MSVQDAFLTGEQVYLRLPNLEEDVECGDWHAWFNDPEITKHLVHGVYPVTRSQQREYVASAVQDSKSLVLSIVSKETDQHLGVISLKSIDLLNRKAEIGLVVGKTTTPGAPLEAMALLMDHGFTRLNLNSIYAGQHEGLWKWVNQLLLIGFKLEGYRAETGYRNAAYYGTVLTSVLAKDYFALKEERGGSVLGPSLPALLKTRSRENQVEAFKQAVIAAQNPRL